MVAVIPSLRGKSESDAAIYRGCVDDSQSTQEDAPRPGPGRRCLTWRAEISISRRPMRRRPMRPSSLIWLVGAVAIGLGTSACAKSSAQPPAPTSAANTGSAPADKVPPGVDISKLDDFGKKVFFRIANGEPSVCGEGQSLLASANAPKGGCGRSVNALRYVARLVDQGFTDSAVSDAIGKRYPPVSPKKIDVSDSPMKGNPNARLTL